MDLFTASNTLSVVALALSGALGSLSIKSLLRSRTAERESNTRLKNTVDHITGVMRQSQTSLLAEKSRTIYDQAEVIDDYRVRLVESEENLVQAQCGLVGATIVTNLLQQRIMEQNTDLALMDEEFEEIELFLRRIHPELPEDVSVAEAVQTIFEAIVASGYAETYGGQENEKGVVARVIERLSAEVEGQREELAMKDHQLQVFEGVFETQGEIIQELRDEKALAEQELTATKIVANDDSADADRYADDLAKTDALVAKLMSELNRSGYRYAIDEETMLTLTNSALRHDVRVNGRPEAGTIGTAAQLAA